MTPLPPSPTLTVWRALLALAVVFVLLATTGWTSAHRPRGAVGGAGGSWAEAVAGWRAERVGGRALPGTDASVRAVAAFFASLGPADRQRLARRHPLVVGNLNGAPLDLRYRANRRSLGMALARERLRVEDQRLSPEGRREAAHRVHRFSGLMSEDRRILAFDPSGTGRVAEVIGDLDRAERVSVIVPGVDTTLITFQRTARRYEAPVGMAESLYAAERAAAPGVRTAVIAWADYTAPTGVGMDAVTGRLARSGAERLVAMTEGLPGNARVAWLCHSYGSVVCGLAARRLPSRVSDIAVAGSPGMRAERAADIRGHARVWTMLDPEDWIADMPHMDVGGLGHGPDPNAPEFGARRLSASGAGGHGGYFLPGTDSVRNLAGIGVGAYGILRCADADDACRRGIFGTESA
ncbi:hypothetical protein BJP40_29485 [Streptomyces sp. CC53]|uniref:alpha/beta hydrolase n=1 Tax=unclassified Streptomyces TaxID=2593676 RepID=UPI0008DCDC8A|nr:MULTISPECIES: alpha/beta hydrolase [unclassified Streptomyces]OII62238.1 hypothetical protein BJP40_29485 [Streptomyces sp. CC53]